MVTVESWMDIKSLHRQGFSIKEISRRAHRSRNSVRKVLRSASPPQRITRSRGSLLDAHADYLRQRWFEHELSAVRLHEELVSRGFTGSEVTVRRFVSELKRRRYGPPGATVRYETAPGQQAQADWASCGRFLDPSGRLVSVYAFVMVLSFSRMRYVEFTTSMRLCVMLQAMQNAFAYFGGVPSEVLFDNMKQVRLSSDELNPLLLDFARHYGFSVKTHRPRRPQTKGKVERAVRYVKDGFLNGRTFRDLDELQRSARTWMQDVNARVHGTTKERPSERLGLETLAPFGDFSPYRLALSVVRRADREGFVRFEKSRYSVPPDLCGKKLVVGPVDRRIVIRLKDVIVAEHQRAQREGATVAHPEHVAALWHLTQRRLDKSRTPLPSWRLTFEQAVQCRPLAAYQEASS